MPIPVECSGCGAFLRVPDTAAGRKIRCPKCGEITAVEAEKTISALSPFAIRADEPAGRGKKRADSVRTPNGSQDEQISLQGRGALFSLVIAGCSVAFVLLLIFGAYQLGRSSGSDREPLFAESGSGLASLENSLPEPPSPESSVPAPRAAASHLPQAGPQAAARDTAAFPSNAQATQAPASMPVAEPVATADGASVGVASNPATVSPATVVEKIPVQSAVEFQLLPLDEPVTSYTVTENGRYAIFSHQAANLVTVFDIAADRVSTLIATAAPRAVMCRGDELFVANFGEGKISVFSISKGWALDNELQVNKPNVMYMSAAGGRNYAGEILVTCHDAGKKHPIGVQTSIRSMRNLIAAIPSVRVPWHPSALMESRFCVSRRSILAPAERSTCIPMTTL